jgi:hypothetical protein
MKDKHDIAARLKFLRRQAGYSMAALANEMGMKGASSYQRYEAASNYHRKQYLPFDTAVKIARVLDGNGIPPVKYTDVIALSGIERAGEPAHTMTVGGASGRSPAQILKHHLAAIGSGDLYAAMADFAETSVIISPKQTLRGLDDIQKYLSDLIKSSVRHNMTETIVVVESVAMVTWRLKSSDTNSVAVATTFVFRGGLISALTTSDLQ